jgi:hypothetical protein
MQFIILDFNAAVAPNGGACIAHGLDRALRVLETWGLLRGLDGLRPLPGILCTPWMKRPRCFTRASAGYSIGCWITQ